MMHNPGRNTTITRESTVETPLHLEMRTANGRVQVRGVAGTTASVRASIQVPGYGRDQDERTAERVAAGIVFAGNALTIESPDSDRGSWHRGLRVHYEVSVPYATVADLKVANGPVEIRNIEGPLELELANGPVTIEEVAGAVEVEVANGPVHVTRCRGAIEAAVTNGPLRIDRSPGPVDLKVSNGPVDLEEIGGGIEAKVSNGPISYRGAIGGHFDLSSNHGGIFLRLPADSRFELDAEAERGEVVSDFRVNEERAAASGARAYSLRLRTQRGDIRLQTLSSGVHANASAFVTS